MLAACLEEDAMRVNFTKNVPSEHKQELDTIAHEFADFRKRSSKVIIIVGSGTFFHEGTHHRPFFVIQYFKGKIPKGILRVVLREDDTPLLSAKVPTLN